MKHTALEVRVVKTPGNKPLSRNNHLFDVRGGTLGRAEGNTWVLPDPDKFLSSCHCEIVFADNCFYLQDRSTNGTFLNGSSEPIGRGSSQPLANGDFFEIGDYQFSVTLSASASNVDSFGSSPFGTQPLLEPQRTIETSFDNFFDQTTEPAALFDQQTDPLALWDKPVAPTSSPFDSPFPKKPAPASRGDSLLDDFMGISTPSAQTNSFASMDLSPGMDQAVNWPSSNRESLIPEDWADDLLDLDPVMGDGRPHTTDSGFAQSLPFNDAKPGSPFNETPVFPAKESTAVQTTATVTAAPVVPRPPLAERIAAMQAPAMGDSLQDLFASEPVAEPQNVVPPVAPPINPEPANIPPPAKAQPLEKAQPPAMESAHASRPVSEAAVDSTLIDALGLDRSRLSEADMTEISRITGKLMREIIDGMLGVLRSRASIKNEFRMNVTTIQPVENNPLKFSVSVDDALENIFLKKSNAYKKPVEAFREGFQEIAEHQLAMIAGIRQGFEAMMERFDPEQLEKGFIKQNKGSVIPGMQKAKYWNSYLEYYQGFTDNMETSFQHLFGSDFVTAYEDQLRRLAAARKKDNHEH